MIRDSPAATTKIRTDFHDSMLNGHKRHAEFFYQLCYTADHIQLITFIRYGGPSATANLHVILASLLDSYYVLATTGLPMSEERIAEGKAILDAFRHLDSFIYAFCEDVRGNPEVDSSQVTKRAEALKACDDHPLLNVFNTLVELYNSQSCGAPDCLATFASKQRKFKCCSKCQHVYYCLPTCQKRAWLHDTLPHKKVCHAICFISNYGQLGRGLVKEDIRTFIKSPLFVNQVIRAKRMIAAESIVQYIQGVQQAKMTGTTVIVSYEKGKH